MVRKNIVTSVVTGGVLLLLGLFAWRVLFYVREIKTGRLDPRDLSFLSDFTVAKRAATTIPSGEFNLVTDDDPFLGSREATVRIVEFADFGCPFCRKSSYTMRRIAARYGDRILYVYRDFPVTDLHPDAARAAEAGECAEEQGKFWEYHDVLYQNQSDLSEDRLVQYAERVNMDRAGFIQCLRSGRYTREVREDYEDGLAAGVQGTPTFFVNGNIIPGSIPESILEELILSISPSP